MTAAREVYAEAAQDRGAGTGLFGRPALERLIAHPKLLPIYEEFAGDDQLHLVSAGLLHDQPKAEGAPLQPGQNVLRRFCVEVAHSSFDENPVVWQGACTASGSTTGTTHCSPLGQAALTTTVEYR